MWGATEWDASERLRVVKVGQGKLPLSLSRERESWGNDPTERRSLDRQLLLLLLLLLIRVGKLPRSPTSRLEDEWLISLCKEKPLEFMPFPGTLPPLRVPMDFITGHSTNPQNASSVVCPSPVSDLRPLDLYLLVAKLQIVTATAPRPVLVQLVRTGTSRTAAGGQLTVATGAGNEAGHTSCGQRVDKGHFRGS